MGVCWITLGGGWKSLFPLVQSSGFLVCASFLFYFLCGVLGFVLTFFAFVFVGGFFVLFVWFFAFCFVCYCFVVLFCLVCFAFYSPRPTPVGFQRTLVSSTLVTRSILNSIISHAHKEQASQAGSLQPVTFPLVAMAGCSPQALGTALGCCEGTWCASVRSGPYSYEAGGVQMSQASSYSTSCAKKQFFPCSFFVLWLVPGSALPLPHLTDTRWWWARLETHPTAKKKKKKKREDKKLISWAAEVSKAWHP